MNRPNSAAIDGTPRLSLYGDEFAAGQEPAA
jgi:hypothetical protein